ncbi:hypothetical protein [Alteribacillus sp. HJP-4]|uniref:hypothetical protein n=1 Tax=Alteribacillus sp. HJP-4 TaxID=2775394 RepID=UPI0035CD0AA0
MKPIHLLAGASVLSFAILCTADIFFLTGPSEQSSGSDQSSTEELADELDNALGMPSPLSEADGDKEITTKEPKTETNEKRTADEEDRQAAESEPTESLDPNAIFIASEANTISVDELLQRIND